MLVCGARMLTRRLGQALPERTLARIRSIEGRHTLFILLVTFRFPSLVPRFPLVHLSIFSTVVSVRSLTRFLAHIRATFTQGRRGRLRTRKVAEWVSQAERELTWLVQRCLAPMSPIARVSLGYGLRSGRFLFPLVSCSIFVVWY